MAMGEKIKTRREALGMTQQMLAERVFVTRQTVSRWESGSRCPDLLMAKTLSEVLDISLDELMEEVGEVQPQTGAQMAKKRMLAGIFLLVLSLWFLVFSALGQGTFLAVAAVVLAFPAAFLFIWGYFE